METSAPLEDSAVAVAVEEGAATPTHSNAQVTQTTPASKLRRFSGILDSAVRSFLGCRSPLSTGSMEEDLQTSAVPHGDDSNMVLFSPGKEQRKRRVPLSSVNNNNGGGERSADSPAAGGNPRGGPAGAGAGSHSAVKGSSMAAAPSPAACDLITSSQRKTSKKKRLLSPTAGSNGATGERENVLPRNLNKTFATEATPASNERHGAEGEEEAVVDSSGHFARVAAAGKGNDQAAGMMAAAGGLNAGAGDDGGAGKARTGGGLSNLLFSPMFTLLGRNRAETSTVVNPLSEAADAEGAFLEDDLEAEEEGDDGEGVSMAAAASVDLSCEEKSLVGAEEESYEYNDEEEDSEEVDYDYSQSFDPFYFIKNLPPLETCVPAYRKNLLPKQTRQSQNKKTLVLDLDETLVHSSLENELPQDPSQGEQLRYDFTFPVHLGEDRYDVYVYVRPGAIDFLEKMQELFEVVIFTASQKMYAEKLLNILDPERRFIRHRLFRDSCVLVEGNYLKDLSVIGRDLKDTIIVDNSPQAFAFQLSNGVPIESWFDDQEDTELTKLIPFLKKLSKQEDVRPGIVKKFKLHEKVRNAYEPY